MLCEFFHSTFLVRRWMGMKKPLFVMMMCAALVGVLCLPLWAVDAPKGPMELKVPAGATATKAPVKFSHDGAGHKADCKTCHHKEGANMKCSGKGCHDSVDP